MVTDNKEVGLRHTRDKVHQRQHGDKQESTIVPGNDAMTGAAVGSPSMNGIWWMLASPG